MKIKILFQSTTDKESGEWITLPAQNNQIDKFLEEVSIKFDSDFIISKIKNNLNLDIICTDDIYYLNDFLSDLNSFATDKEIVALFETYSDKLEDILSLIHSGKYEFYPDMSLGDVAYMFSKRKDYKNYTNIDQILDNLSKLGYEETSTGVIQVLGY